MEPSASFGRHRSDRGRSTLYAPRWLSFGAPVVRKVGSNMDRPEQLVQLWELSESETGLTLDAALAR